MKLLFKQRLFSWFDSYDIYDEAGNTVYVVKGQLSWGHKLVIYDAYGNEVGMVVQKVLTFLPKFEIYKNGSYIGCLSKEFSFLTPHYNIDYNGWHIDGTIMEWDYKEVNSDEKFALVLSDAKAQVSYDYDTGRITTFLISTQHQEDTSVMDIRPLAEAVMETAGKIKNDNMSDQDFYKFKFVTKVFAMKGIKIELLGIAIIPLGIAVTTNNFWGYVLGVLGFGVAVVGCFLKDNH